MADQQATVSLSHDGVVVQTVPVTLSGPSTPGLLASVDPAAGMGTIAAVPVGTMLEACSIDYQGVPTGDGYDSCNIVTKGGRLAVQMDLIGAGGMATSGCVHSRHDYNCPCFYGQMGQQLAVGNGTIWMSGSFWVDDWTAENLMVHEIFMAPGQPAWYLSIGPNGQPYLAGTDWHGQAGVAGAQYFAFLRGLGGVNAGNVGCWYDWAMQIGCNTAAGGDGFWSFWCHPNTGSAWDIGDMSRTQAAGGSQVPLSSRATAGYPGVLPQVNVLQLKQDLFVPGKSCGTAGWAFMYWMLYGTHPTDPANQSIWFDRTIVGRSLADVS